MISARAALNDYFKVEIQNKKKEGHKMRKYGANHEVINAYFQGHEGPSISSSQNVYFSGDVLYSYGRHFPLAVRLQDGTYMLNGDTYSPTTSCHQADVRQCARGRRFTTSINAVGRALQNEGFWQDSFAVIEVVDYTQDLHRYDQDAIDYVEARTPEELAGVHFQYKTDEETEEKVLDAIHRAGTTLFKIKRSYWLAGMDENQYFITKLPRKAQTVQEAFFILKPDQVKAYEEKTGLQAARQGEWFFIPVAEGLEAKKIYKKMGTGWFTLPGNGNPHRATRGWIKSRQIFISGQVRHPQHRMARLSKSTSPVIFQAFENNARANFSFGGVD
jgi:hypothetical protein